jgi:hypothetical protein
MKKKNLAWPKIVGVVCPRPVWPNIRMAEEQRRTLKSENHPVLPSSPPPELKSGFRIVFNHPRGFVFGIRARRQARLLPRGAREGCGAPVAWRSRRLRRAETAARPRLAELAAAEAGGGGAAWRNPTQVWAYQQHKAKLRIPSLPRAGI